MPGIVPNYQSPTLKHRGVFDEPDHRVHRFPGIDNAFSEQTRVRPTPVRGLSGWVRFRSKTARCLSNPVSKHSVTVSALRGPVCRLPKSVNDLPKSVSNLPGLVRDFPKPVSDLPKPDRDLSNEVSSLPHRICRLSRATGDRSNDIAFPKDTTQILGRMVHRIAFSGLLLLIPIV